MSSTTFPAATLAACLVALPAVSAEPVTYCKDVAPILSRHCAACHRPGEVGPFPLLTYRDAARRARHLAEVTADRRMPPWHAEPGPLKFLDERRLSAAEVRTLVRWAAAGAPEGDPRDLPPAPRFPEGWQLGKPDLVLTLPRPFTVPADGQTLRVFTIPIPVEGLRWVKGLEFRPGNRKVVHHANLFLDPTGEMRKHAGDGGGLVPGAGFERPALQGFPGLIGAWTPGHTPRFLPEEIAQPLRPSTDLVLQIHYQSTGKPETDRSSVGLFFSRAPGRKYAVPVPLSVSPPFGNTALLDIPAGRKRHKVVLTGEVPADSFVHAVHTHAHYLLREVTLTATPPGGKPFPLLRITNWDFNWQDRYVFAEPPRLARGTRLEVVAYYDNSAANPQNPSSPPKDVHFGISSTDEMLNAVLVLLPAREVAVPPGGFPLPADAKLLRDKYDLDHDGKLSAEEIAALPPRLRLKVETLIEEQSGARPAPAAAGPLRLPPGGFPLPADAKLLREKYDKDHDGKLSQEELGAIPRPLRDRVEELIRKRLNQTPPGPQPPQAPAGKGAREPAPAPATGPVTYCRDVAPILSRHCAACHRPGEVGPFPLLTYRDAARRARHLAEVTADRRMPPWLPEPGPLHFVDERRLSEAEVRTLARWAEAGAPEGDARDLPPPPRFPEGWQLGKPDLVLTLPRPFTVPADGGDVYQTFVLPVPLTGMKWVKGFEFRPGNRKVLHHANVLLDSGGTLRRRADTEDGPGFRTVAGNEARQAASGALGGWRPGTTPRFAADGFARPLRPGTDVVLNVHYHPSGKPEQDRPSLGLYFTDVPGKHRVFPMPLFISPDAGNAELLNIPACARRHRVALTRVVPADASVQWVTPHAHYLLRELKLTATPPGGKPLVLLEIKSWDFNQQDIYHYEAPPRLPRGTRLDLVGFYDNSAANPQNPSSPPKNVHWGERTTDEMFAVVIGLMPEDEQAAKRFAELFARGRKDGPAAAPLRLPPGGFPLPADAKLLREKYDKDHDGKLSQEELEAIPRPLRDRVEQRIRKRLGQTPKGPDGQGAPPPPAAPRPPQEGADPARGPGAPAPATRSALPRAPGGHA
jgi:mono/diheme cytochrome c family protein